MNLNAKALLVFLLASVVPVTSVSLLAYASSRDALDKIISGTLAAAVSEEMHELEERLAHQFIMLRQWSQLQVMQDVLIRDELGDIAREIARLRTHDDRFAYLLVIATDGQAIAASDTSHTGLDLSTHPAFLRARDGAAYRSAVGPFAATESAEALVVSNPILADYDQNTVIGVLVGVIEWGTVQRELAGLVMLGEPQSAHHRYLVVEETHGRVLYDSLAMLGGSPIADTSRLPRDAGASTGNFGAIDYIVGGARSRGTHGSEDPGWWLYGLMATDVAYAEVYALREQSVIIATLALGGALALVLLLTHALVRPIVSLARAADRVAEHDFDAPLPPPGDDEVGRLARSFELMRTAVRRHEAELTETREEALAANRAKSEFLAAMSHEIRTPLNGVLGMTDLLLRESLPRDQRRLAETIQRSGVSLLEIINDILDFSKVEAGRVELENVGFDPRVLVEDAGEMAAPAAHRKGLELVCIIEPEVPSACRGDPVRLRQVLINLVSNAVKFTRDGEVTVRASILRESQDEVVLRFEVSDTGVGIAAGAREQIFDAFVQADRSTTRRFGGSGLGLAISRHLIELMGGRLDLHSTPGQGSRFWFDVSLARCATSAEPAVAGALPTPALVVSANRHVAEGLVHRLAALGVRSAQVDNGPEALRRIAAAPGGTPPPVVFIDGSLGGMAPAELARAISAQSASAAAPAPVRLCLVGEDTRDTELWKAAGVTHQLTKPVRQSALYDCLLELGGAAACERAIVADARARELPLGARVLLAEDHAVNQEVGMAMLRLLGCEVTLAHDGPAALDALAGGSFDVVLMDCDMPELDGFETTRALRRRERDLGRPRVPVIAVTANALKGDRERCLAAGMDDYLSKPIDTARLRETLQRWLPDGAPRAPAEPAAREGPPPADVLDGEVLAGLRLLDRNEDGFLASLVQRYGENWRRDFAELVQALAERDGQAARKTAHKLKSASANLGARNVAALCQEIESAAGAGRLEDASARLRPLGEANRRALDALQTVCREAA